MKQIYKQLGKVRPTVEGDWSIDKTYTLLSIVYDEVGNASYISRKDVPAGIQITNKEYWTRFSNTRVNSDSIVLLSKIQDDGLINSYNLQEAIDSFKIEDRRLGTFISFYEKPIGESTDYRWNLYQFNSNNIDDWNNTKYWQSIYYIQNKFLGLFSSEESLKRTRPFPIIGDYAFVGATLKEAVVYRCNNIGVWTRTNEKAKDYLSINLKGDITISEEGNWIIDGVDTGISSKGENGKTPLLRIKDYKWQVSYDGGIIYKDIPNSPIFVKEDNEDIVGDLQTDGVKLLKFANKEYNANKFSGLGRVYLRKNIVNGKNVLTQEMINKPNTIYIIQYDYDLNSKTITSLNNCILQFDGGSFINGKIHNFVININYNYIFKDNLEVICSNNSCINPFNFGAKLDGITDDTIALNRFFKCLYYSKCDCFAKGTAFITNTITIPCSINAPDLNFVSDENFAGTAIHIDNYRFNKELNQQNGENMIRNVNIVIGNITTSFETKINNTAIEISSCRELRLTANAINNFKNGLFLNSYDGRVGFISYSTFNIRAIINCCSGIKMRQYKKFDNSNIGWVTECVFNDTHISNPNKGWKEDVIYIDMQADEGNTFDGHSFNSLCLEGAIDNVNHLQEPIKRWAIVTKRAISNVFYNCRFEVCKKGAIKRIINDTLENPYPNIFICMRSNYDTSIFDNYLEHRHYYTILAPALFNSNIYSNGGITGTNKDLENKILTNNDVGIHNYVNLKEEKPKTASTKNGSGIVNIRSYKDYENEGSFILWTDASSNQEFYLKKGKMLIEGDNHSVNFRDDWYRIKLINDNDKERDTSVITPTKEMVKKPKLLQFFEGYEGLVYYNGKEWVNIYGTCAIVGGLSQKPTSFRSGSFYLAKSDTYQGKPIWAIGGTEGTPEDDKWVRYDGESSNALDIGDIRPKNVRHNGRTFYDKTINKLICYKDTIWVDSFGNPANASKKGTTAQRPTGVQIGFTYKDTDLNKWIIWNGETWENIDGTALG